MTTPQTVDYEGAKKMRDHHTKLATEWAQRIRGFRFYAIAPSAWNFLAGLSRAIAESADNSGTINERFVRAVEGLGAHTKKSFRPKLVAPETPKPLTNPTTGAVIDFSTLTITEKAKAKLAYPDWYAFNERFAKAPISALAEIEKQKADYELRKNFEDKFAADNFQNVFRSGDHMAQVRLQKSDPQTAEFLREEAMPASAFAHDPQSPNLTIQSKIAKENPALHDLCARAAEIASEWSNLEERQQSEETARHIEALAKAGFTVAPHGQRARRPMAIEPLGSVAQEHAQKLAAAEHDRLRAEALSEIGFRREKDRRILEMER